MSLLLDSIFDSPYPCIWRSSHFSPLLAARIVMALHAYAFLFVVCLFLLVALLWRHDWLHHQSCSSQGEAKRSLLPRRLQPRCPDDCPACRLASTVASSGELSPAPVRPWCEVKSRRGAPKRVNTEGFACPNSQCPYAGITDAQIHTLVGDGTHGRACRTRPFVVRRATRRSLLDPTPPCIA